VGALARTVKKLLSLFPGKEVSLVTTSWAWLSDTGAEECAECSSQWKEHIFHRSVVVPDTLGELIHKTLVGKIAAWTLDCKEQQLGQIKLFYVIMRCRAFDFR
jgi:hypothetical protein